MPLKTVSGQLPPGQLPPGQLPPDKYPPDNYPPRTNTPWTFTPLRNFSSTYLGILCTYILHILCKSRPDHNIPHGRGSKSHCQELTMQLKVGIAVSKRM